LRDSAWPDVWSISDVVAPVGRRKKQPRRRLCANGLGNGACPFASPPWYSILPSSSPYSVFKLRLTTPSRVGTACSSHAYPLIAAYRQIKCDPAFSSLLETRQSGPVLAGYELIWRSGELNADTPTVSIRTSAPGTSQPSELRTLQLIPHGDTPELEQLVPIHRARRLVVVYDTSRLRFRDLRQNHRHTPM
jgi:hypothetical protein